MNSLIKHLQQALAKDFTLGMLKLLIISVALVLMVLAFTINDKWVLAGILAYEVLP